LFRIDILITAVFGKVMWRFFQKNGLDQIFVTYRFSSMICRDDICRLLQMATAWSAYRLRVWDPGAVIELATGPRHLGQAGGSEGVYGYESCNDSGYLDRFNVSKLLCRRELL